jgi:hypothetical protein
MHTQTATAPTFEIDLVLSNQEEAILQEAADLLGCSIQDLIDKSTENLLNTLRQPC